MKVRDRRHYRWDGVAKRQWNSMETSAAEASKMKAINGISYNAYSCHCGSFHVGRAVAHAFNASKYVQWEDQETLGARVAGCLHAENSHGRQSRVNVIKRHLQGAQRRRDARASSPVHVRVLP